jgi:hypothetical protein
MMSTALDLTSISVICIASSPLLGWLTSSVSSCTPSFFRPGGIEGVLGVDEGGDAVPLLRLGHGVQGERGFAARLRGRDLDDAAPGKPLTAQGDVEREAAGGNSLNGNRPAIAQRHDRAFAGEEKWRGRKINAEVPFPLSFFAGGETRLVMGARRSGKIFSGP